MKKVIDKVKESWGYYKAEIKKSFNDLRHKDTFYKQIPNLLTLSRIVGMIPVSILFLTGNNLFALILLGLVFSTDFFDGKIARKYGISSKFGADLDAVSDKFMALLLMVPLCFLNPFIIFNIIMELMISFVNVKGRINDVDTKTIFSGKVKTWFLSVTLLVGYISKFIGSYYNVFLWLSLFTGVAQIKAYNDYIRVLSMFEHKPMESNFSLEEPLETVKKEEKLEELKRERERLASYNKVNEKTKAKVRKRKK